MISKGVHIASPFAASKISYYRTRAINRGKNNDGLSVINCGAMIPPKSGGRKGPRAKKENCGRMKPIITPRAYRRSSNTTTADTALPPTRHRHYRQRHRHCHRSAGRSCLYVERAPSPLPLHVVASWKRPPSSLRGKDLTGKLSLILSDAVWLGVTAVLVGGEV